MRHLPWTAGRSGITCEGGTACTVKIGHQGARALDRYLRAPSIPQTWRDRLWLGVNGPRPLTLTGIYLLIAHRGRQAG